MNRPLTSLRPLFNLPGTPLRKAIRAGASGTLIIIGSLFALPTPQASAYWLPSDEGPYRGDKPITVNPQVPNPNWSTGSPNWLWFNFNAPFAESQEIYFTSDQHHELSDYPVTFHSIPGTAYELTLRSDSEDVRVIQSNGGYQINGSATPFSVTFGTNENPLTILASNSNNNTHGRVGRFEVGQNATLTLHHFTGLSTKAALLSKLGDGTLVLRGSNTYIEATRISAGTLALDFSQTPSAQSSDIIAANTPRALHLYGGELKVIGRAGAAVTQGFETTVIQRDGAAFNITLDDSQGSVGLHLGIFNNATTRQGLSLNFSFNDPDSRITYTQSGSSLRLTNGILIARTLGAAFSTVNRNTWATATVDPNDATRMVIRGLEDSDYQQSTLPTDWSNTENISLDQASSPVATTSARTINSLRLKNGTSLTLGNDLTVTTGGILITGNGPDSSISGGRLLTTSASNNANEIFIAQNSSSRFTLNSQLTGSISLVKGGTGTLVLAPTVANTHSGGVKISEGTLEVNRFAEAIGTGKLSFGEGKLLYTGDGESLANAIDLGTGGSTIDSSGTGALKFTNTNNIGVTADLSYPVQLTLTGTNQGDNILAGRLGHNSAFQIQLVKDGIGTWTLTGTDSVGTNRVTINQGTLKVAKLTTINLGDSLGLGGTFHRLVIQGGGRLEHIGADNDTTNRGMTIGAGGATLAASGAGTISYNRQLDTTIVHFGTWGEDRTLTFAGSNTGDNTFALYLNDNGPANDVNRGKTRIIKDEAGTWVLAGDNTFSGGVEIRDGILKTAHNNALGDQSSDIIINGGTLQLDREFTRTGALSVSGNLLGGKIAYSGSSPINIESGTITSTLETSGNTVKTTSGKATLSGVATFFDFDIQAGTVDLAAGHLANHNGLTIVRSGAALLINHDYYEATTHIDSGGTLGGSNTLDYTPLTLANGARLAPGSQQIVGGTPQMIGTLAIGGPDEYTVYTTFEGNITFALDLNNVTGSAGSEWDQLALGSVNLTADLPDFRLTLELTSRLANGDIGLIAGWDPATDHIWESVLLLNDASPALTASNILINANSFLGAHSANFYVTYNTVNNAFDLHYNAQAIPEPGTVALLIGSLGGLILLRRKRR